MPIRKNVNVDFFKTWTIEMAYVLGFFAADGYITINKRGGQFWCIQITDKELLESIKKVIRSNHTIGIRMSNKPNQHTLYRLQIGSKEMCTDLKKLGFGVCKTKRMQFPNIPQWVLPHFIRGYFDGDGNVWVGKVHKKRTTPIPMIIVMFTSCSKEFLTNLHTKIKGLGILGGCLYCPKHKRYFRLQFHMANSLQLSQIMYNRGAFGNLYLDRKKRIFEAFLKMRT